MSGAESSGEAAFSVVVPVYRGAAVVGRSLASLARQVGAPPTRVVAVVNDGSDATLAATRRAAAVLQDAGAPCSVITSAPGRRTAIAVAEALLPPGPRLYLDQDAALSPTALHDLAAALSPGTGAHFAAPSPLIAVSASTLVRLHHRAWSQLPYVRESPATMGAYAVSWEGRQRWDALPTLHSDDKFVRLQFEPSERLALRSCTYEVVPPSDVRELVRARRRYQRGNAELRAAAAVHRRDVARHRGVVRHFLPRPGLWPAAAVLLGVHAAAAVPDARTALTERSP